MVAVAFFLSASALFSQGADMRRGTIPGELLRPRREESPRYPVDMVIGPLGQGSAPRDAYNAARRAAEALLDGLLEAPILSTVNRMFLEDYMSALNEISPRFLRLGGGREEPDGSVSFLVRFVGRDMALTGELFVRLEERRQPAASPPVIAVEPEVETPENDETEHAEIPNGDREIAEAETEIEENGTPPVIVAAPPAVTVQRVWLFEDLILEAARSREEENRESRARFDFSPYERFF